jgi:cation transporter-like permease
MEGFEEDVENRDIQYSMFRSMGWAIAMIVIAFVGGSAVATGAFLTTMKSLRTYGLVFLIIGGMLTFIVVSWVVLHFYNKYKHPLNV